MFRLDDLPAPPRRNVEDLEEDLLEGLGADTVLKPPPPPPAPVLRWTRKAQGTAATATTIAPLACRRLVVTTRRTAALLPLLLGAPSQQDDSSSSSFYEERLLGAVLVPGVPLSGNRGTSPAHPGNAGCFLYRGGGGGKEQQQEEEGEGAVDVVFAAVHLDVPTESLHALAALLASRISPSEGTLILDLLHDGGADPGDELAPHSLHGLLPPATEEEYDAPFLVRHLSTSSSSSSASADKLPPSLPPALEVGVPVTGLTAALLARMQLLRLPATALLLGVRPSVCAAAPLGECAARLRMLLGVVADVVGSGCVNGKEDAGDLVAAAAKAIKREGSGRRTAVTGGSMLYM